LRSRFSPTRGSAKGPAFPALGNPAGDDSGRPSRRVRFTAGLDGSDFAPFDDR
jgi:hypothetical protein